MKALLLIATILGTASSAMASASEITFHESDNFGRRRFNTSGSVSNLGNTSFNDRASSLRVESGYWIFCSDANFRGERRTFGPGDYPALPYGLDNRISSGRRISNDFPYNASPGWN
jgi:hypothetical protein